MTPGKAVGVTPPPITSSEAGALADARRGFSGALPRGPGSEPLYSAQKPTHHVPLSRAYCTGILRCFYLSPSELALALPLTNWN